MDPLHPSTATVNVVLSSDEPSLHSKRNTINWCPEIRWDLFPPPTAIFHLDSTPVASPSRRYSIDCHRVTYRRASGLETIFHSVHGSTPSPRVDDLSIEKAVAIAQAEALIDLHHPARLLPSELLQEIFSVFVEDSMSPTFEELATGNFVDSRDLHAGPWLLSRVSSRWRSIVFAMPHLWTRMNLNLDREKQASWILFKFHQKSSPQNSKYHVNIYSRRSDIEDDEILSLSSSMTYYHRQSLGISLPGAAFFGLNYRGREYASLQDVRVHIQSPATPEEEGLPVIPPIGQCALLERAPRLRSLVVNNVVAFRHIFRVRWDLVTRFEVAGSVERAFHDRFAGDYVACVHEVLGKFGRLEYASLCPDVSLPYVQSMEVPVENREHPSLRHLKLGARIRDEVLLHVDLPSLEILHFADYSSSSCFPKPLGPRTGGSIKELSIFVLEENTSSLIDFLRSTSNLRILEVRTVAGSSLDVGTLGASILGEDGLVPHLKKLRLRGETIRVLEVIRGPRGKELEVLSQVTV